MNYVKPIVIFIGDAQFVIGGRKQVLHEPHPNSTEPDRPPDSELDD